MTTNHLAATAAALALALPAAAQTDALDLQSAPPVEEKAADSPLRAFIESGFGRIDSRVPSGDRNGRRLSLDLRYTARLDAETRLVFSNRLDHVSPPVLGNEKTVNSLRELYLGWQPEASAFDLEFGRINLRQGVAYGYNPTDHFRTGGLRTVTTADPVTLRQIRQGAAMLKGAWLWEGGSATAALAPRLRMQPETGSFAVDLSATNNRDRALLAMQPRFGERISAQASVLFEQGRAPTLGLSATALFGDALVAHAELVSARRERIVDLALGVPAADRRIAQAALGLTYTLPTSTALTLEYERNGAGLQRDDWRALRSAGPAALQRFVALTQPHQELGARDAWLLYLAHKGLGLKQLDLTAFIRRNRSDRSHLGWLELRYHWPHIDAVLQWQQASGNPDSEFGSLPVRRLTQVLGVVYF